MQKSAVRFDVTDLSRAYAGILKEKFNGNRLKAEKDSAKKLAGILQIKNYQDDNINFVLKNWSLLLLSCEKELLQNSGLKKLLKKLFMMKAKGSEEDYIKALQQSPDLKKMMEGLLEKYLDTF